MGITVTWLGHSTVLLAMDGVRVLTDPVLRRSVGPLRRVGPRPSPDVWQAADVVLLSHLHHDHADLPSLRMLGAERPVLTSSANAAWLRRRGLNGVALTEGEWSQLGPEVDVTLVRADHQSRPMPHRPNDSHGHLVRGPSGVVWVAGDTSLYDEMDRIHAAVGARVDLAIVPVGGWGARLSNGHLDPAAAAKACVLVGARSAVPVHWGTLHVPGLSQLPRGWMERGGPAFVEFLCEAAPSCRPLLLEVGGTISVPSAHE
jgi:L-ascorbate metabolism protein UlaG (beta-lactamase superfamily)